MAVRGDKVRPHLPVVYSERADGYSANAVAVWFLARFREIGIEGASSHSGRRTFITAAAKKITEAGGSLRDVQELAGHSSLATTQRYIQGDTAAKRNVIALIFGTQRARVIRPANFPAAGGKSTDGRLASSRNSQLPLLCSPFF